MGGLVQLVVRKKNDSLISFPVWTNSVTAHILKNPMFFRDDTSKLDEFVLYHEKLMKDYNENQSTGEFKNSDTQFYGKHNFGGLHPVEYGIIYIDLIEKKIFDMQDYTNTLALYSGVIWVPAEGKLYVGSQNVNDPELLRLDDYISKGFISKITYDWNGFCYNVPKEATGLVQVFSEMAEQMKGLDFETAMEFIPGQKGFMLDYHIDKNGFETTMIKRSDDKSEAYEIFKSFNLPMTDDDHAKWKKFIIEQNF